MRVRRVRIRVGAVCLALLAVGASGCWGGRTGEEEPIAVGTTEAVAQLDPAGAYDAGSWALYGNVYQSLLTLTPGSSRPVPDAARQCGFQGDDLQSYTCALRPGLTFSNGHPLTAEDVTFSFRRLLRINSPQGPSSLLDTLGSVAADGPDRVTFRLKAPDATFPFKIATGAGSIVDHTTYPADRLRTGRTVDGSGPYLLDSYAPGDRAALRPNPHYQGAAHSAPRRSVTVRWYADPAGLSAAWRRKQLDVAARQLPPADLARLSAADSGIRVSETASANARALVFNLRDGSPVKPLAVRRAIAAVVDRDALARDVHLRTVDPLYSLIPQGLTGHSNPFYDAYPVPDPDRARQLLRDAGIALPVRFTLVHSRGAATGPEAETLKAQLERTGLFQVTTRHVPWEEFQQGYARGAYDAYALSWLADYPDPDTFTSPLVGEDNALHNGYSSPRMERLIRATRREERRDHVAAAFRGVQEVVAEDVPLVPLWQKKDYVLTTSGISGGQYLSDGTGIWRLWELARL
ncbi:peptide-binding protein [Streptomyces mashuensis]|uniref:Peptide-binding protein n=1 Tax=Streptomyces mashuensis TaxID=33904 RepID=A0A919EDG5_9ACTN|nr:ABC transporter substrate-binding protein [Streptomyces mashuensis]GHF48146.1 peptide-binding protein [Streptomyces mashuensis]